MHTKLAQWLLQAALFLSPDRNHFPLVTAIDQVLSEQNPIFANDPNKQRTAALVLAVNFREGSLIPSIRGDKDKNGNFTSFCSMQIHLPYGAKTEEGWTGEELAADPVKCVTVGVRMLRVSRNLCPKHPVAFYAEGVDNRACTSPRAQRISNDRMFIAHRLIKEVKWSEEHASAQPTLWPVHTQMHFLRMFWDSAY